jgi:hypothetical protein
MAEKIRWGILSTANIGMQKVTPAIQASPSSEVVAIASRDPAKARAAADQPRPMAHMRNCSPIPRSTLSTIPCPITCMSP